MSKSDDAAWDFRDAIKARDVDAIRRQHAADPSIVNSMTTMGLPIELAAGRPAPKILQLLLELGADPNVKRKWTGGTPLSDAASHGLLENVKILHRHGAILDTSTAAANPLWGTVDAYVKRASREASLPVARYLLDAGIDTAVRYDTTRIISHIDAIDFAWENGARHIARAIAELQTPDDPAAVEARLAEADRTSGINVGRLPAPKEA